MADGKEWIGDDRSIQFVLFEVEWLFFLYGKFIFFLEAI